MDKTVSREKFVPKFVEDNEYEKEIKYAEFLDNFIIMRYCGLHSKVIKKGEGYHILEFENGSRWEIRERPWNRKYIYYPMSKKSDIAKMFLRNINTIMDMLVDARVENE